MVPRLLTGEWRNNVLKFADLIVEIPVGHKAWPKEMHESLILALLRTSTNKSHGGNGEESARSV